MEAETPLEQLMRDYAREADAPGALTAALVALAVHQENLEARLRALRAESRIRRPEVRS